MYEYRVIDTDTLKKLIDHQASDFTLWRRLRGLFRKSYLDRPREAAYLRFLGEEKCLLWAIGRRGYEALAPRLGLPLNRARKQPELNSTIRASTLAHNLGLNKFRACIEISTRAHDKVSLHFWKQRTLKTISVTPPEPQLRLFHTPEKTITLLPDALFALHFHQSPPPNKAHWFVEWDNGTTPTRRWTLKKGLGYAVYFSKNLSQEDYGFGTFQVLIVAPSPQRKESLRQAIRDFLEETKRRGTCYPDLWLFTDRGMYSLDEPLSVLDTIWQTATSDQKRSLLD